MKFKQLKLDTDVFGMWSNVDIRETRRQVRRKVNQDEIFRGSEPTEQRTSSSVRENYKGVGVEFPDAVDLYPRTFPRRIYFRCCNRRRNLDAYL